MKINNWKFDEGLLTLETLNRLHEGYYHVTVLDDMIEHIFIRIDAQNLCNKYYHYYNFYFLHELPIQELLLLICPFYLLMLTIRDESQTLNLYKQLYPVESHKDVTFECYGYLVIDCDPKSPRDLSLRTFPD